MRKYRFIALAITMAFCISIFMGCSGNVSETNNITVSVTSEDYDDYIESPPLDDFSMFICSFEDEIVDGNELQELIASKTNARVKETYLVDLTAEEAIDSIIKSDDYPDFIYTGDYSYKLYEAGALVPWDEYLEKYSNLKELYSDAEWELFRQDDGHIYWVNPFNNTYGESKTKDFQTEAFWIQTRVLEWANYPQISTLDQYLDLLESYYEANTVFTNSNGEDVDIIPYTCLNDDWLYSGFENPPLYLDGYYGDIVGVDTNNKTIVDYNISDTARRYFERLNEEYRKGYLDSDFATQTNAEYLDKLSTGAVLGMCDQYWNFSSINSIFKEEGLDLLGCDYVPLGLTIDEGTTQHWYVYGDTINFSGGCAVTKACEENDGGVDNAFELMNNLLEQGIHNLRFWGIEGEDYLVDEDGLYYRTDEMRERWEDPAYQAEHCCPYSYLPQWCGTSRDGVNAMKPEEQASEYYRNLSEPVVKCLKAYGAESFADMIGSEKKEAEPWYPLYVRSSFLPAEEANAQINSLKHEWLPQLVMAEEFDVAWKQYIEKYTSLDLEDFYDYWQSELDDRLAEK